MCRQLVAHYRAFAMRALVKHDEPGLRLEELPTPEPGPDEVLIEVHTLGWPHRSYVFTTG